MNEAPHPCLPAGRHPVKTGQAGMDFPAKKDGLYWETKVGEEQSPFSPVAARAVQKGYAILIF